MIAFASLHAVASSDAAAQTSDGSVMQGVVEVDGHRRTYRLFVRRLAAGERYAGTVVVLHGGGRRQSGATVASSVGFDGEAAGRRLIAVYPDARGGTFHAGHCCGIRPTRGDDVRFVVRLVGLVQRRYAVDARRTFATGFSNGAFLAYRLACQQARRFPGVASVGGTEVLRSCRPERPVSVLHIHGRDDLTVREPPDIAATVEAFTAAAKLHQVAIDVIDVPDGQHSFDMLDHTDSSRAAVTDAMTRVTATLAPEAPS